MHDGAAMVGASAPGCRLAWGVTTHPGRVRPYQQDGFLAGPPVFVVADGMGGHARGEAASEAAIQAFSRIRGPWVSDDDVLGAIDEAAVRIANLAGTDPAAPGTTVVGAGLTVLEGRVGWLVFNVGDSRAYRLSGGSLEQISVDHSRVQELSDEMGLDRDVARNLPGGHVITRALGGGLGGVPEVDRWVLPAVVGDRILLCSDGLTDEVHDQEIARILLDRPDPQDAALALQEAALAAGGRDNVTVLVVEAVELPKPAAPASQVERLLDLMGPEGR